jgi:hypothetical protein
MTTSTITITEGSDLDSLFKGSRPLELHEVLYGGSSDTFGGHSATI